MFSDSAIIEQPQRQVPPSPFFDLFFLRHLKPPEICKNKLGSAIIQQAMTIEDKKSLEFALSVWKSNRDRLIGRLTADGVLAHSWMEQLSERGQGQYDQDGVGCEGLESGGCSFSTESKLIGSKTIS
ncbi:hypothetical protein F2Q69_00054623 [Brassica cretica]|uniref:Uncharacterized protein n=1 Tax=Brassica cretica TaxID=69181 RepID=A0A8S9MV03_BRACR|nr:hypothetical protein F2Q69_00054623 [Brassica cretica]